MSAKCAKLALIQGRVCGQPNDVNPIFTLLFALFQLSLQNLPSVCSLVPSSWWSVGFGTFFKQMPAVASNNAAVGAMRSQPMKIMSCKSPQSRGELQILLVHHFLRLLSCCCIVFTTTVDIFLLQKRQLELRKLKKKRGRTRIRNENTHKLAVLKYFYRAVIHIWNIASKAQ